MRSRFAGVIPRTVQSLLAQVSERESKGLQTHTKLSLSFLELYNEKVYDLLEPKEAECPVRENHQGRVIVANLAEVCACARRLCCVFGVCTLALRPRNGLHAWLFTILPSGRCAELRGVQDGV